MTCRGAYVHTFPVRSSQLLTAGKTDFYFHICFHTDGSPFQLCEEYIVHTLQLLPRYDHKEC